jgi:hypothetical protein
MSPELKEVLVSLASIGHQISINQSTLSSIIAKELNILLPEGRSVLLKLAEHGRKMRETLAAIESTILRRGGSQIWRRG